MRYAKGHKETTRQQILDAASHAFRAEGVGGVGIGDLMGQVGLTHGGFYAHFDSKEALLAEACARGLRESVEHLLTAAAVASAPDGNATPAIIRAYLSRQHRDNPATGCVLPALAGEIRHESPGVRHAFTDAFTEYVDRLATFLTGETTADAHDAALVLASGMAGAMLLARAVDDPALSDRILRRSRDFYTNAFTAPGCEAETIGTDDGANEPAS